MGSRALSGGVLIASVEWLHLSDPLGTKQARRSGVCAKPLRGGTDKSVTPRWLPFHKFIAAALCCRLAETPVWQENLRLCETHKAGVVDKL